MELDCESVVELPYYCSVKVHRSICQQLIRFIDRIAQIFSAIESVRPRSKSGIPALCLLQDSMDKAKSLVQHCSESSKFYLAITGVKILSRSEKIRDGLESSLSQIQNIVPLLLAAKISGIIHDIRQAQFHLDYADKEAGKIVLSLLRRAIKTESDKELEALQIAASKLKITSPVAALTEKRCVKRLIGKFSDSNNSSPRNKKIMKYLYRLLKKHGSSIWQCKNIKEPSSDFTMMNECLDSSPEPPGEFKCPISTRLMYDPSIVASGQTFERVWIERWFDEGNDTCPVTSKKLEHLCVTPNSAMKSLIQKWCSENGIVVPDPSLESLKISLDRSNTSSLKSITSFNSNFDDIQLSMSSMNSSNNSFGSDFSGIDCDEVKKKFRSPYTSEDSQDSTLGFLSSLADLSWESQCKVVRDVKNKLEGSNRACLSVTCSDGFVNPLINFMKDASTLCYVDALSDGADVLLAILRENRNDIPRIQGETIYVLTSFLESEIAEKALSILEILSYEQHYMSSVAAPGLLPPILKLLENPTTNEDSSHSHRTTIAMKILCNLSINNDIGSHMVYLNYVPTLVRFLRDKLLARHSVETIKNLCSTEEGRIAVSESPECLAAVGELLSGPRGDEQEHALEVLLSLCHHGGAEYRYHVMTESVVESLVLLSVNGNSRVKLMAMEMLRLDGHESHGGDVIPYVRNALLDIDKPCKSRSKKFYSKAFWSLSRDVSRFAKSQ